MTSASAATLKVTGFPTSDTAGVANDVTVTAYDAYGNVAHYTGTIAFASTDPKAVLPSAYTFVPGDDGSHTFAVTLETAGAESIAAVDTNTSSIDGSESGIEVQAAAARTLAANGFPTSDTAGVAGHVTLTAYDAYGNVATGYTGTIAFAGTDPKAVLPSSYTFAAGDAGSHTFSVTLETAGTQSFTATDANAPGLTSSVSGIIVTPASAHSFAVTGFPAAETAGGAADVTVTAYDAYGNVATGYTGTIAFTSTDPKAVLPSAYTFAANDAGSHTFPVTLETAGTQSITATDKSTSSIAGSETGITVSAAAASSLDVTGFPAVETAGVSSHVTVAAYDAYGNVATGYTGTIAFTSTDPKAVLPSGYTFAAGDAGSHTFSVTFDTAGTQSITATDANASGLTASETGISVRPGAAHSFTVMGFPAVDTAGLADNVTVTAYDAYGNVATGYTGTIAFTSTDPKAVLPSGYTFAAANAGTHTFPVALETAGTQSITATDKSTSSIAGSETGIAVSAAAASTLDVTGFPTVVTAGVANPVTVTAYDAYGNVATGYTGTIAFASTDPKAVLPSSYTFAAGDAGSHTFSVTLETAGTQSFTATDANAPDLASGVPNIDVTPAAASTFKATGFSAVETAGSANRVTVTAYDAYGNVATGYTGTIAFTSTDPKAVLPSAYTFAAGDAGSHTFPVTLETAGTQSITATDANAESQRHHRDGDRGVGGRGLDPQGCRNPDDRDGGRGE